MIQRTKRYCHKTKSSINRTTKSNIFHHRNKHSKILKNPQTQIKKNQQNEFFNQAKI